MKTIAFLVALLAVSLDCRAGEKEKVPLDFYRREQAASYERYRNGPVPEAFMAVRAMIALTMQFQEKYECPDSFDWDLCLSFGRYAMFSEAKEKKEDAAIGWQWSVDSLVRYKKKVGTANQMQPSAEEVRKYLQEMEKNEPISKLLKSEANQTPEATAIKSPPSNLYLALAVPHL